MRVQLVPAYVLHTRPYSESSLLVETFSREHGRGGLIARGARRRTSRWQGLLQPFNPLLLSWSARGELGTLTEAEAESGLPPLDKLALFCGMYVNELLMRLLARNDPHQALFGHYEQVIGRLRSGDGLHGTLRWFEKRLLEEIGFGLQLDCDAVSHEPLEARLAYRYDLEAGPVAASGENARQRVYPGAVLIALAREDFSNPSFRNDMRHLLQGVLTHYLGDRPLASQKVLHAMMR